MKKDNKKNREVKLRRYTMKGFVMEEEDKLLQDEMCNAAEISRQL